jgi:DNA-binding transcriptional MerR regulator
MYETSIRERLAVIQLAKMAGFDLVEIRQALSRAGGGQPAPIWRTLVGAKRADLDLQMSRLVGMKDVLARMGRCTCATLDECGRAFNEARSQQSSNATVDPTVRSRSSASVLTRRGSAARR